MTTRPMSLSGVVTRIFACVAVLALAIYAVDYAVWRVRMVRGTGMEWMVVSRVSIAPLKGRKEEYYFDGTDTLPCTRSLLPLPGVDGWGIPCWWLMRHRQVVTRY